jgi:hypothetical protein
VCTENVQREIKKIAAFLSHNFSPHSIIMVAFSSQALPCANDHAIS